MVLKEEGEPGGTGKALIENMADPRAPRLDCPLQEHGLFGPFVAGSLASMRPPVQDGEGRGSSKTSDEQASPLKPRHEDGTARRVVEPRLDASQAMSLAGADRAEIGIRQALRFL